MQILCCAMVAALAACMPAQFEVGTGKVKVCVVDPNGAPVPSARITLAPPGRSQLTMSRTTPLEWQLEPRNLTDAGFVLEDVPATRAVLFVVAPPFAPARSQAFTVAPDGVTEVTVAMRRGGSIAGCVRDAAGRPVVGAEVRTELLAEEQANVQPDTCALVLDFKAVHRLPAQYTRAMQRTDRDGRFRFTGLVPAMHEVRVEHQDYAAARRQLQLADGAAAASDFTVREGAVLEGIVMVDGKPAARAAVIASRAFGPQEPWSDEVSLRTKADDEGRFRMPVRLGEGSWAVTASSHATANDVVSVLASTRRAQQAIAVRDGVRLPPLVLELTAPR